MMYATGVLVLWCVGGAPGANLVRNGDFAQAEPGKPAAPLHWQLPARGHWQRLPTGGPGGGRVCATGPDRSCVARCARRASSVGRNARMSCA